jgi:hypothetical protein
MSAVSEAIRLLREEAESKARWCKEHRAFGQEPGNAVDRVFQLRAAADALEALVTDPPAEVVARLAVVHRHTEGRFVENGWYEHPALVDRIRAVLRALGEQP